VVRKGVDGYGHQIIGFRDGWRGVLEGSFIELDLAAIRGILPRGGTILGSSRTNPYKRDDGTERVRATFGELNLDGLIAIGGDDTLGVANRLHAEGVNVVGVPKTISVRPTSPSASTPRCTWPPRRSTGSIRPRRATTASSSSR